MHDIQSSYDRLSQYFELSDVMSAALSTLISKLVLNFSSPSFISTAYILS
mgnify:CR=1 FL=1